MLSVSSLNKAFGGQLIFRDVNWFVEPKGRVALVGPNGSGKSTLLLIVAGLEAPDGGTVERPKGLRVGYLAQTGFVFGEGTVREEAQRGFDEIMDLQRELEQVEGQFSRSTEGQEVLERLSVHQAVILERLSILGAYDVDRQVHGVLTGLGFREEEFDRPLATFSGGWQMRAALARILLQKPELLLLDEPTNHLDLEAREWLEGFLNNYPYAFVIVSHDRYFLDVTVKRVTEIIGYGLEEYAGNYSAFEKGREKRCRLHRKAYERQQDEIRRLGRFIDRFRYKNTKAAQVQSRIKMLKKMQRIAPPEPPKRRIVIPTPACPRSGKVVLELRRALKAYGPNVVLNDVDLRILRGARVALVGSNGAGKSTLMRVLAGVEPPDAGERATGYNMRPAFFAQDHGSGMDPSRSVLDSLMSLAPSDFVPRVRSLLGAFLFSGDAVDKKISILSGGERNRLAMARLFVRPSNLLLLDEPTNHLDIPAKDVLLEALKAYEGTVVFVSHDRRFLSALADHIIAVGSGRLREHPGGYESYLWRCRQVPEAAEGGVDSMGEGAGEKGSDLPVSPAPPVTGDRARKPLRGQRTHRACQAEETRLRRRARRVAEVEAQIAQLEDRRHRLNQAMSSPDFFANQAKADLYLTQFEEVEEDLAALYREWEELADHRNERRRR